MTTEGFATVCSVCANRRPLVSPGPNESHCHFCAAPGQKNPKYATLNRVRRDRGDVITDHITRILGVFGVKTVVFETRDGRHVNCTLPAGRPTMLHGARLLLDHGKIRFYVDSPIDCAEMLASNVLSKLFRSVTRDPDVAAASRADVPGPRQADSSHGPFDFGAFTSFLAPAGWTDPYPPAGQPVRGGEYRAEYQQDPPRPADPGRRDPLCTLSPAELDALRARILESHGPGRPAEPAAPGAVPQLPSPDHVVKDHDREGDAGGRGPGSGREPDDYFGPDR